MNVSLRKCNSTAELSVHQNSTAGTKPATCLELVGNPEFLCVKADHEVNKHHDTDGSEDSKVRDHHSNLYTTTSTYCSAQIYRYTAVNKKLRYRQHIASAGNTK